MSPRPSVPSVAPFVLAALVGTCLFSGGGFVLGHNLFGAVSLAGVAARSGLTGMAGSFILCVAPGMLLAGGGLFMAWRTSERAKVIRAQIAADEAARRAAMPAHPAFPDRPVW